MIKKAGRHINPELFLEITTKWFRKPEDLDALKIISQETNLYRLYDICLLLSIATDHDSPKDNGRNRLLNTFRRNMPIGPQRIAVIRVFLKTYLKLPDYVLDVA